MITTWMLGFAVISLVMGGTLFAGIFGSMAVLSWLCVFTYHAFLRQD